MFHPEGPTFWELARQALSSTERGCDLIAPKFDVTPFRTPDAILKLAGDYVRARLAPGPLLDLACGTGAVLEALGDDHAVGLDFSGGMLAVARENVPSASYVRADLLRPPFDRAFDLVTCFSALGHVLPAEGERFVHAVKTCLRPGGHFVFVTSTLPPPWSWSYWFSRGFNAAMHVRNALVSPAFIMYYLTFLLPEATARLEAAKFRVSVPDVAFPRPYHRLVLVDATLATDERR